MSEIVYLNGSFVPYDHATVSVEDRGMLFADGIYEVVRAYDGRFFLLDDHLERMRISATEIRLKLPPVSELRHAMEGVLERSPHRNASVYIGVTRGFAGPRSHTLPVDVPPTVFAAARPTPVPDAASFQNGAPAITVPDRRWHMCHVKSIGLLLNTLAKQAAIEAGAQEALFVRDGVLTEGSATNAFAVIGGEVFTHPEGPHILSGITRQVVLEICRRDGIPVREQRVPLPQLYTADEVFVTGTNSEVLPVVTIDGKTIGTGRPGPIATRLLDGLRRYVAASASESSAV